MRSSVSASCIAASSGVAAAGAAAAAGPRRRLAWQPMREKGGEKARSALKDARGELEVAAKFAGQVRVV